MKRLVSFAVLAIFIHTNPLSAQISSDSSGRELSLEECIQTAISRQPSVKQFAIDEAIADQNIRLRLSEWFPQIGLSYNVQHNILLPTSFLPDANGNKRAVKLGVQNTSNLQMSLSQNLFNRELLLASRSSKTYRSQAAQYSTSNKIEIAVAVSKAYYDLLLTQKQVSVLDENIVRLQRSLKDAFDKYEGGIVDKIDYKRAQIALNTTRADRKRAFDQIAYKTVYLQELMGLEPGAPLVVRYDSLEMEKDVNFDTLQIVDYNRRIEFQLLQTEQQLLEYNLRYNKWSYLPTVAATASYNPTFQNDRFLSLYNTAYPTSFVGLQLNIPIFQGGRRIHSIKIAELQLQRLGQDKIALGNRVNSEYAQALAGYKGNLANLNALKENLALAGDVYNTLQLQYSAGIKTYLEVIIAETEFRSAQINYLNAMYEVLSAKLDLQRAMGIITY